MTNTTPVILLVLVGLLILTGVAIGVSDGDDDLAVIAEKNLIKITNVGDGSVEITNLLINDRKECASIDLLAGGTILKVGDERLYISPCNVVRATVTTKTGSNTYTFK